MTTDTWIGVLGDALGVLGLGAAVLAFFDARRQRTARERAVIAANAVIERTYGLLIGIKPFVASLGPAHEAAINDGLNAINQQRTTIERL